MSVTILNKLGGLLEIISFPDTPEERDAAENELRDDIRQIVTAIDRAESLARYLDGLAPGDQHYAKLIRAAIATT